MFVGQITWRTGPEAADALRRYADSGPAASDIPPMPDLLIDLLTICFREDPVKRPASMKEVAEAFREIL
jgi:hypothetical protein